MTKYTPEMHANGLQTDHLFGTLDHEEASSKRRPSCYPACAVPVEVLTHLPGPRRISE